MELADAWLTGHPVSELLLRIVLIDFDRGLPLWLHCGVGLWQCTVSENCVVGWDKYWPCSTMECGAVCATCSENRGLHALCKTYGFAVVDVVVSSGGPTPTVADAISM